MTIANGSITKSTINPISIASAYFDHLEAAWNVADGAAFGEVFADETDFVNIRGEYFRGDGVLIGQAHQGIFESIYVGSTMRYEVEVARQLTAECIVAVVTATLDAPSGPLQGVNQSRITAVMIERDGRWSITGLQNTLISKVV